MALEDKETSPFCIKTSFNIPYSKLFLIFLFTLKKNYNILISLKKDFYMIIYNSIANLIFSESKDSNDRKIEGNFFTLLPINVFEKILSYLSLEDLRLFKLTSSNTPPIVKAAITQIFLDNVQNELTDLYDVKISLKSLSIYERYHQALEKTKKFKKCTYKGFQAKRSAISALFENRSIEYTLEKLKSFNLQDDKFLLPEIFKNRIHHYDSKVTWRRTDEQNDKNLILFLKVLRKNQSDLRKFTLEVFDTPLSEKVLNAFVRAIFENHSFKTLNVSIQNWNAIHLNSILEAVKQNKNIERCLISEINYDQNLANGWWWQRQGQEKHLAELNRIVQNHLKDVSYNQGNWHWKK